MEILFWIIVCFVIWVVSVVFISCLCASSKRRERAAMTRLNKLIADEEWKRINNENRERAFSDWQRRMEKD